MYLYMILQIKNVLSFLRVPVLVTQGDAELERLVKVKLKSRVQLITFH